MRRHWLFFFKFDSFTWFTKPAFSTISFSRRCHPMVLGLIRETAGTSSRSSQWRRRRWRGVFTQGGSAFRRMSLPLFLRSECVSPGAGQQKHGGFWRRGGELRLRQKDVDHACCCRTVESGVCVCVSVFIWGIRCTVVDSDEVCVFVWYNVDSDRR
jgi:hypothetical protein